MAKGLRYLVALEKRKRFLEKAGISQADFFLASFPKSGNTWLRYLLAAVFFPDEKISQSNLSSFMPSVYDEKFELKHLIAPRFIKTHEAFFSLYPKTIYLVRDYRDAVVSSFYYLQKRQGLKGTISEFIKSDKINAFGTWQWHVQMALEFMEQHPKRILFVKYESLLSATEKELQRILEFCGVTTKQNILEIVQAASFATLRKKEAEESKPGGAFFFRKGVAGDWKNDLSPEDVDYLLRDKKTKEIMKRLGYSE
jgi:hypothetical protein